jgi:hypothetical protein
MKYYWRVQAVNTSGEYSAWSAARYFRTSATAVFNVSGQEQLLAGLNELWSDGFPEL